MLWGSLCGAAPSTTLQAASWELKMGGQAKVRLGQQGWRGLCSTDSQTALEEGSGPKHLASSLEHHHDSTSQMLLFFPQDRASEDVEPFLESIDTGALRGHVLASHSSVCLQLLILLGSVLQPNH